jgi:hypothetical protein
LQLPTVAIKDVLTNFILDVAWRQIIGLNVEDGEIYQFYGAFMTRFLAY